MHFEICEVILKIVCQTMNIRCNILFLLYKQFSGCKELFDSKYCIRIECKLNNILLQYEKLIYSNRTRENCTQNRFQTGQSFAFVHIKNYMKFGDLYREWLMLLFGEMLLATYFRHRQLPSCSPPCLPSCSPPCSPPCSPSCSPPCPPLCSPPCWTPCSTPCSPLQHFPGMVSVIC